MCGIVGNFYFSTNRIVGLNALEIMSNSIIPRESFNRKIHLNNLEMDSKKIVIITASDFPSGSSSAKLLRMLSVGLQEANCKVTVLLQEGKKNKIKEYENKNNTYKGVKYKYFIFKQKPTNKILMRIDRLTASLGIIFKLVKMKILKKIDYVIVYNHYGTSNLVPLVTSKILNIKSFAYVVDWLTRDIKFKKKRQYFRWLDHELRMRYLNFKYNGLILISTYLYNYYKKEGYPEKKLYILPNLTDEPSPKNTTLPHKKNIRIAFSGKPTYTNGANNLLEIFKIVKSKYSDCELLIMGDTVGNKQTLLKLKERSKELGIQDSVTFTGMISHEEVLTLLSDSDILVLPRPAGKFAEAGFPTKLGEYLMAKKPVVINKVGDVSLYFKHKYHALIAIPGDNEEFAQHILWLINNKEQAYNIACNGCVTEKDRRARKKV